MSSAADFHPPPTPSRQRQPREDARAAASPQSRAHCSRNSSGCARPRAPPPPPQTPPPPPKPPKPPPPPPPKPPKPPPPPPHPPRPPPNPPVGIMIGRHP